MALFSPAHQPTSPVGDGVQAANTLLEANRLSAMQPANNSRGMGKNRSLLRPRTGALRWSAAVPGGSNPAKNTTPLSKREL
jgi:hypothetical protein